MTETKAVALPWSEADDKRLTELWELGMSGAKIGREIDRTKNSVLGRIHRLGLSNRACPIITKPVSDEAKAAVIQCLTNGMAIKRTMAATGVTQLSVQRILESLPTREVIRDKVVHRSKVVRPPPPPPAVLEAPKPVFVAPRPKAKVVPFTTEVRGPCQWLDGHDRKTWRQCEAMAVFGPGLKPPFAYCAHHRSLAYVCRSEAAA